MQETEKSLRLRVEMKQVESEDAVPLARRKGIRAEAPHLVGDAGEAAARRPFPSAPDRRRVGVDPEDLGLGEVKAERELEKALAGAHDEQAARRHGEVAPPHVREPVHLGIAGHGAVGVPAQRLRGKPDGLPEIAHGVLRRRRAARSTAIATTVAIEKAAPARHPGGT